MEVEFKSAKLRKLCENHKQLSKAYGDRRAREIIKRINELFAANNLYDISILHPRLHLLKQNWNGHFAVDTIHPRRLIFYPLNGKIGNNKSITSVCIVEIAHDYH